MEDHRIIVSRLYDILDGYVKQIKEQHVEIEKYKSEIEKYKALFSVEEQTQNKIIENDEDKKILIRIKRNEPCTVKAPKITDEERIVRNKEYQKKYREKKNM